MPSSWDFEALFFGALSAVASLFFHAAVLALFLSSPSAPPRRADVVIELLSGAPPAADPGVPDATEGPTFEEQPQGADDDAADDDVPALDLPEEQRSGGFRDRLRRRDVRFRQDMAARARRVAALERFVAERQRAGADGDDAGSREGEAVYACGAYDKGTAVAVTAARPMARYADVVPMGLFPEGYLEEVVQIAREGGPLLGRFEMALPRREVIVLLDEPAGAVFALGRRDARCVVGFSWAREVFPLSFRSMPAHYIDARDDVREVLVDVKLHADATFTLQVVEGDALGFTSGSLYDREAVSRNLQQRALGARVIQDLFGALFGG